MKKTYLLLCCIIGLSTMTAQQKNIKVIDSLFSLNKTELSTENTEFSAILAQNNIVYYTSAQSNLTVDEQNSSDLDVYQAVLNSDNSISDAKALEGINTKWHDGPVAITPDGNTMYFASESFNVKKGFEKEKTPAKILKKGRIYIFKATKVDGEWSNASPLAFNNIAYSVRNPSVSADGKTLYFSSDMPGGLGGEDIWKVAIDGNSYGTPENLGASVNSQANESFPFISSKNVLYFSSDDENGFGGMDVYKLDLNKTDAELINIGRPVNSDKDDFAFTLNEDKKTGFVSSNRGESDDIYLINSICRLIASITVTDKETGTAISDAKLDIIKDSKIQQSLTTTQEPILSNLECETAYNLAASKEGYEDGTHTIEASTDGGELNITIALAPIKTPIITETQVVLQPIFFEFDKSNITPQGASELDKLVTVMTDNPDMIILVKSHTDNRGTDEYNKDLSNKRAQATVAYVVSKGISEARIFGKGFGESDLKINCTECTEEENSKNRRSEFMIVR
ncbi:MAG: OmpA family protein [Flavobacteriaceae bacterium]